MQYEFIRVTCLAALFSCSALAEDNQKRPLATDYEKIELGTWKIYVERSLKDHPRKDRALQLLGFKLVEVEKLLPGAAVRELMKVPIWMSRDSSPGACYHPSIAWLQENGRVPEMARSIEIQNVDHFIDWSTTQPMMVLHELAHAWQDRMLEGGNSNPEIMKAYQIAKESGIYDQVLHVNGQKQLHYAMTNPMEYFAECTEAYFGKNDFHPFNRKELEKTDPAGANLVEKMWGIIR